MSDEDDFHTILRNLTHDPAAAEKLAAYARKAGKPSRSEFPVLDEFAEGVAAIDLDAIGKGRRGT